MLRVRRYVIAIQIYFLAFNDINICNLTFPDTASGKWYNHHCDESYGFICKINPGNIGQVTDPPTPTIGGYCPDRYFGIGKL